MTFHRFTTIYRLTTFRLKVGVQDMVRQDDRFEHVSGKIFMGLQAAFEQVRCRQFSGQERLGGGGSVPSWLARTN